MILNLLSLYLGLLALGLGFTAIARKRSLSLVFSSLTACSAALLVQLLEIRRRVTLHDWSAIEDTMEAVVFAAMALLALTIFLNLVALFRGRK